MVMVYSVKFIFLYICIIGNTFIFEFKKKINYSEHSLLLSFQFVPS